MIPWGVPEIDDRDEIVKKDRVHGRGMLQAFLVKFLNLSHMREGASTPNDGASSLVKFLVSYGCGFVLLFRCSVPRIYLFLFIYS